MARGRKRWYGKRKRRTPEEKAEYLKKKAIEMADKQTWPELEFEKILKELGIDYRSQEIVGGKIFDFYIPSVNLLVEIDGDYWHYNRKTNKKGPNRTQKRNIINDKKKNVIAKTGGYKLSRVWESDLKENFGIQRGRFKRILGWKEE